MNDGLLRVEWGEHRKGRRSSVKLYVHYVTPTGQQEPFTKCPFIERQWSSQAGDGVTERLNTGEYKVTSPARFKISMRKFIGMGRPVSGKSIYIIVDSQSEVLEFEGFDGFGKVTFRGRIDYKESTVTEAVMKKEHKLKVVAAPKLTKSKTKSRNLIW